jgi:hypothetical protein
MRHLVRQSRAVVCALALLFAVTVHVSEADEGNRKWHGIPPDGWESDMVRRFLIVTAVSLLVLGGCGDDDGVSASGGGTAETPEEESSEPAAETEAAVVAVTTSVPSPPSPVQVNGAWPAPSVSAVLVRSAFGPETIWNSTSGPAVTSWAAIADASCCSAPMSGSIDADSSMRKTRSISADTEAPAAGTGPEATVDTTSAATRYGRLS